MKWILKNTRDNSEREFNTLIEIADELNLHIDAVKSYT